MVADHLKQCCYREQIAYSFYAKFRQPTLYRYAADGDWDKIPARCLSHPKEAMFVHKYPPHDTVLHKLLRVPIVLCENHCCDGSFLSQTVVSDIHTLQYAAVRALLNCHPAACETRDSFGRLPLHLVCRNKHSGAAVLLAVLEQFPKALCVGDYLEQRTPLHALFGWNDSISVEVLAKVATVHGTVWNKKDVTGETPLEILQRRKNDISNYDAVMQCLTSAGVLAVQEK